MRSLGSSRTGPSLTINAAGAPLEDIEPDSSRLRQGWLSPTSDSQAAQRDRC